MPDCPGLIYILVYDNASFLVCPYLGNFSSHEFQGKKVGHVEVEKKKVDPVQNKNVYPIDDKELKNNKDENGEDNIRLREKIREKKKVFKEKRKEEHEQKKKEEAKRLLNLRPTKHKEKAGGGEPKDKESKERRNTVRQVRL